VLHSGIARCGINPDLLRNPENSISFVELHEASGGLRSRDNAAAPKTGNVFEEIPLRVLVDLLTTAHAAR
jgi:hypothetical protein